MSAAFPMGADGQVQARASDGAAEALLWWHRTPEYAGERVGIIGGFDATSAAATHDVLARACAELRRQGCTIAIGPMDGNTWRKYRFVTEPGTEPPFALEPTNPMTWPAWWRSGGFTPLAEYYSSLTSDLTVRDPRVRNAAGRLAADGVVLRPLDASRFEDELAGIFDVSVISFQQNFLYTELPREEFLAQYRALQPHIRPELVLIAEQHGRTVGYVFAVPNHAEARRGEPIRTIIVKTLAVLPGRRNAGLGAWLLDRAHEVAHQLGYTRAIHALMHETNTSRNLSARSAQIIRRYTLFAQKL